MPRISFILITALVCTLFVTAPISNVQAAVPSGFTQSGALVTVSSPTAIVFSADETLLFITEKGGNLRLADVLANSTISLRTTPVINLDAVICDTDNERGLLGVALDPNFGTNRFFYLFYTGETSNSCASPVNRVSRFTMAVDGTAQLASERILVDNMPSPNGNHNGGDVQFGKDGYLYISIGEGGIASAARDMNVLTGKILRIIANPDLSADQRIPASNPFANTGAVCAVDGSTSSATNCKETFAVGLRNPFRLGFDPNTTGTNTTFYINDVGQGIWEEINRGEAGVDYRWNQCEGSYNEGTRNLCPAPTGVERNPIHEYDHAGTGTSGCNSITGGAVVPNGVWPAAYDGKYLFADYICAKIFMIDPDSPANRTQFGSNLGQVIDMNFGPGANGGRALYYCNIGNGGIFRIEPTGTANLVPTASFTADPQYGDLANTFDGSASSDPNGDTLTYLWDFGNGTTRETTTPTTSYTYPIGGQYTASLQVRDSRGALSNIATLPIDTENERPLVTMISPSGSTTFRVGETVSLQASGSDAEDGTLPATAFRWEVLLHHRAGLSGAHTHPFFGPITGNNLTFVAPAPEDLDAASNSYLEVRLTATDSGGASASVVRDYMPTKVTLTIQTAPANLNVRINGTDVPDDQSFPSWQGYQLNMLALPQQNNAGTWLALSIWENNATTSGRTVTTPANATTYTATFGRDAALSWLPIVRKP